MPRSKAVFAVPVAFFNWDTTGTQPGQKSICPGQTAKVIFSELGQPSGALGNTENPAERGGSGDGRIEGRKGTERRKEARAITRSKWPQVLEAVEDGRIERWLSKGLLEKTIAKNLGVSGSSWEKYKVQHAELREAIKKGNRNIVREIEDALVRRALGYDYKETKVYRTKNKDGSVSERQEVTTKHMAPDVGAACFLLKNKEKGEWSNDPRLAELREKELELRKLIAEGKGEIWPEDPEPGA